MFFFQALPPSSINFTPLKQVTFISGIHFCENICLISHTITTTASFDAKSHVFKDKNIYWSMNLLIKLQIKHLMIFLSLFFGTVGKKLQG
jgi:hypothetical protein